jgi:hypothetical protein
MGKLPASPRNTHLPLSGDFLDSTLLNTYKDFSKQKQKPSSLTFEEKYYLSCGEILRLKQVIRKLGDAISFWKERALQCESDREYYREKVQEEQ